MTPEGGLPIGIGATRWTEGRIRRLIELREIGGLTHREIAERLGVTRGQVDRQVAHLVLDGHLEPRAGMVASRAQNGVPRSWAIVRSQLEELYVAGENHWAMAHQLSLTRIQVHTQLHRLFREGLPKR
jgi:hypothetical protein